MKKSFGGKNKQQNLIGFFPWVQKTEEQKSLVSYQVTQLSNTDSLQREAYFMARFVTTLRTGNLNRHLLIEYDPYEGDAGQVLTGCQTVLTYDFSFLRALLCLDVSTRRAF